MKNGRMLVFVVVLCIIIGTWVAMSELLQNVQGEFPKPWFIAVFIHVIYTVMLIPAALVRGCRLSGRDRDGATQCPSWSLYFRGDYEVPMRQFVLAAAGLSVLAAFLAWTWYYSLPRTAVGANATIYQSASGFVYVLSIFLLNEKFNLQKAIAVLVSIGGVTACSLGGAQTNNPNAHPSTTGYIFLIVSTFLYALYEVLYSKYAEKHTHLEPEHQGEIEVDVGHIDTPLVARRGTEEKADAPLHSIQRPSSRSHSLSSSLSSSSGEEDGEEFSTFLLQLESSMLFLGLMGVGSILFLWPFFFIFDATGLEPFQWPDADTTTILLANALMDAVYNVALLLGVLVTSPLILSCGTMLVAPASIIVDFLVHSTKLTFVSYLGVALVILGFYLLNADLAATKRLLCCERSPTEEGEDLHDQDHGSSYYRKIDQDAGHPKHALYDGEVGVDEA